MDETIYHIAISVMSGGAGREFCRVRSRMSAREFYESVPLYARDRVAGHVALEYAGSPLDVALRIAERAESRFIRIVTLCDEAYPPMLAEIADPPPALYCIGRVPAGEMISIVGTREASEQGISAAARLSCDLSSRGIAVVSGMARGIDRAAHLGALESGGATVGVLAHGIDRRYPASNEDLFSMVERSPLSSLVSEYPPGVRAGQWTFALRNRIISGLSRAVIVVQAGVKSGAMITARYAAEQGRDLYAVGGFPYDESYGGCRALIKDGGLIIGSASELCPGQLSLFPGSEQPSPRTPPAPGDARVRLSPDEEKIIALIGECEKDIDEIIRESGLKPYAVAASLVSLEVAGLISRSGSTVSRKR